MSTTDQQTLMHPLSPEALAADEHRGTQLKVEHVILLTTTGGDGKTLTYRINKRRMVLGSVVSADVRLTGEGISPIHAVLEATDEGAYIYDLASETGVFVNDRKSITAPLKDGDTLKIGRHQLRFRIEDVMTAVSGGGVLESEGKKLFLNPNEDLAPLILMDEKELIPVFDYRPTSKKALEVIMSFQGTILDVEHFTTAKAVTVGETKRSDFGIPPLLEERQFKIVTRSGDDFILNITPKMKGVMHRKGKLATFDELRQELSSIKGAGTGGEVHVPISKSDFAKVVLGDVEFYLSYTVAPPRLKRRKLIDKDAFFFKIFCTSLLLTALTCTTLLKMQVPKDVVPEEVPPRIATILYQPEKYQTKPTQVDRSKPSEEQETRAKATKPKVEPNPQKTVKIDIKPSNTHKTPPKEMVIADGTQGKQSTKVSKGGSTSHKESRAKEGEGARAKGKEGTRGSKTAAVGKTPQNAALRPSPEGGKGRGAGNSQVLGEGNLDILKGATGKIQDLLGNSAAQLGKGGEKLKGFGGFTTQGGGGLALSGKGEGGGGDAASLGGLGTKGRGGGKVGTGLGAAGTGNGIVGGSARVALKMGGPEETVIMGSIDPDAIEAAIRAHKAEFKHCYDDALISEPKLQGSVTTSFVIGSSGRVTQAGVASTTMNNERVERCVVGVIKKIDFPLPRGAGVVQVTYPFKFGLSGK